MKLVAPLVPEREDARLITWGGAAACDACRLRKRDFEAETGMNLGEGCFSNRGDGRCLHPPPDTLPALAGLWSVWRDSRNALVVAGMDGVLLGRDLRQVEVVAAAHGEPLDPTFLERFAVLVDAERLQDRKARK